MKKFFISLCTLLGAFGLSCVSVAYAQTAPAPLAQPLAAPQSIAAPITSALPNLGSQAIAAAQAVPATGQAPAAQQPNVAPATQTAPSSSVQTNDTAANSTEQVQPVSGQVYDGKVIDANTKAPLEGVRVTIGNDMVQTNAEGSFHLQGSGEKLMFRTPGYTKQEIAIADLHAPIEIALTPFKVKGLYLSDYGVSSKKLRDAALQTMQKNNLNALVIDFKGDRGLVPFKIDVPFAQEIGAQKLMLIKDMPELISRLKNQHIYLIARIVVFKDDTLAGAKPEWAAKKNGVAFRDNENLRWVDPFRPEVWNYNIALAKAAAQMGFDEVQFDYVRCPDKKGIVFSQPSTEDSRTQAITTFLTNAHKALVPYNVMLSADIFGYVLWNTDDTGIGQKIDHAMNAVDIVSPMLYPSGFQFGIPNYRNPIQHPYEIILLSLKRAQERTHNSPLRFRPWLQAFRDYAFHGGDFAEDRMRQQIKASDTFGASGYLFWNPRNVYPAGKFEN